MESYTREQLVALAKCCEQTERYVEMKEAMKKVVELKTDILSIEERNLLSVAYKNIVGSRRSSWRALHSLQQKDNCDETVVTNLRAKVLEELKEYSKEIIDLLEKNILTNDAYLGDEKENYEHQVFYYKMKGDYLRYVAEVLLDDKEERKKYTDDASKAYSQAKDIADKNLDTTSSVYLGLVLNFSVFYYEIAEEMDQAIKLAEQAFDNAVTQLEVKGLDGNEVKDSTLILQLLRDNLTLWKADQEEDDQ